MIAIIMMIKEFLPIALKLWKGYKSIEEKENRAKIAEVIKNGNIESTKKILNNIINN